MPNRQGQNLDELTDNEPFEPDAFEVKRAFLENAVLRVRQLFDSKLAQ